MIYGLHVVENTYEIEYKTATYEDVVANRVDYFGSDDLHEITLRLVDWFNGGMYNDTHYIFFTVGQVVYPPKF